MPETNPKVMEMVQDELKRNRDVPTADLYEKAKKLDPEVEEMSTRQFHARYPLQIKRQMAPSRPAGSKGRSRKRAEADREAVKGVLLQLAKDVAGAEGKADMVEVISGVDKYVERVIKATGGR